MTALTINFCKKRFINSCKQNETNNKTSMNIYRFIRNPMLAAGFLLVLSSCMKNHSLVINPILNGNMIITFSHHIKGNDLKFDSLIYTTSLGNRYQVNNLKYFISELSFHLQDKKWMEVTMDKGIHYTDARDNYSCSWWLSDLFPAGTYDTIAFTFGLNEQQNQTGLFPNPPERDMFWPDILGGGYHYLMMDLKWKNSTMTETQPFDFHLGIGQVYAGDTLSNDSIIGFIQNYFRVILPCKMIIVQGKYQQIILQMDVDKWFDGKFAFNFADYPEGMIMQVQEGMFRACVNGRDVFSAVIPK